MALLQANVSPNSIYQNKTKSDAKQKDDQIGEFSNIEIVSDNAIQPATGPLGVADSAKAEVVSLDTSIYVVRKGDTISTIADMFDVSTNTILWANDMKKGDKINEGDVLFILPISGLEHTVTKGQTLQSIAKLYKVGVKDIIQNNDISENAKLSIGDNLIIPHAT